VEVRFEDSFNPQAVGGGIGEVLLDVSLRVDNDRSAGVRVANHVRSVRETRQVVLLEEHCH
jgi:hypothetical protein